MKFLTALLGLLVVSGTCYGQGYGGLHIPAGGGPMPNYYSGTNCRVSGDGMPGGPIEHAYLYILANGIETKVSEFHADPGFYPLSITLKAMFDSSHFVPGTYVATKIKIYVLGNPTPYVLVSTGIGVQNRVISFQHPDTGNPDPMPVVHGLMAGSNYDRYLQGGGAWAPALFLSQIAGSNAVAVCSHGNPSSFDAGDLTPIFPSDITSARTAQIGSGIPPFNSGSIPVNYFYLCACQCGQTNNFVEICLPFYMAWGGPWMEDQGWMGYKVVVFNTDVALQAELIWSWLRAGWTGRSAQIMFESYLINNPGKIECEDAGKVRDMEPGDLAFYYGPDNGTLRLKTVYTGNNTAPGSWPQAIVVVR